MIAPDDWEYTFHAIRGTEEPIDLEHVRDELLALGDAGATIRFRQELAPARDVVFAADPVPGFGWRTYRRRRRCQGRSSGSVPTRLRCGTSTSGSTSRRTTGRSP